MYPARTLQSFAERWAAIRARIESAAARAGRDAEQIGMVGASKQVPAPQLREAALAGLVHIGENRVQEARAKSEALADLRSRLTWHLIGHLQSNKAKPAASLFDWVHSIDSLAIAHELDRRVGEAGRRLQVLVEVNTSGEGTKFGVAPERAVEILASLVGLAHLEPRGFMTVGPLTSQIEASRRSFRRLAELLEEGRRALPERRIDQLSMGMSDDFELAIEEGATWVRIGTALFGPRPHPKGTK